MPAQLTLARPSPASLCAQRSSRRRPVQVLAKKEQGGIHDPVGVGQEAKAVKKLNISEEEQRRLMQQRLQQQAAAPSKGAAAGLSKGAAAEKELLAVAAERDSPAAAAAAAAQGERPKSLQSMEADEEFQQMHPAQKWFFKTKEALYEWLKTGVEPL